MKTRKAILTLLFALIAVLSLGRTVKAQTVYSDNFQRANQDPLGTSWSWFGGYFQLNGDLIEPQYGGSTGYGGAYMYEGPIATDQFSQVTVGNVIYNGSFTGASVRMTNFQGGTAWYEFHTGGTHWEARAMSILRNI